MISSSDEPAKGSIEVTNQQPPTMNLRKQPSKRKLQELEELPIDFPRKRLLKKSSTATTSENIGQEATEPPNAMPSKRNPRNSLSKRGVQASNEPPVHIPPKKVQRRKSSKQEVQEGEQGLSVVPPQKSAQKRLKKSPSKRLQSIAPISQMSHDIPSQWKTGENLCMLSAMFKVMDPTQQRLVTVRKSILHFSYNVDIG